MDKLVEAGYVSREENNEDRRIKNIKITPKGRELVEEIKNEHQQKLNEMIKTVPEKDRENLQKNLKILNGILRSMH